MVRRRKNARVTSHERAREHSYLYIHSSAIRICLVLAIPLCMIVVYFIHQSWMMFRTSDSIQVFNTLGPIIASTNSVNDSDVYRSIIPTSISDVVMRMDGKYSPLSNAMGANFRCLAPRVKIWKIDKESSLRLYQGDLYMGQVVSLVTFVGTVFHFTASVQGSAEDVLIWNISLPEIRHIIDIVDTASHI